MSTPTAPLLEAVEVEKRFFLPRTGLFGPRPVRRALGGVSFRLEAGASLGVVGETGSGKSTLARICLGLLRPDAGSVRFMDRPLRGHADPGDVQMVFQDPKGSLDPRRKVAWIVAEPLHRRRLDARRRQALVEAALDEVGLDAALADVYPHELSGGQRQRVAIARALIPRPRLICLDEPVSALDVSIQAQVLNLLLDLRARHGLAYLLISHDLAVVAQVSDEILVLADGRAVDGGRTADVLKNPRHPYTRTLLDAVLPPDPARAREKLRAFRSGRPRRA